MTSDTKNRLLRVAPYILIVAAFGWGLHDSSDARDSLVRTGQIVSVDGCNRDFRTITRLRNTFIRLDAASKAQYAAGNSTKEQRDRAHEFYASELRKNRLPDCREAAKIISAEGGSDLKIPEPRYPGDGRDGEAQDALPQPK